MSILAVDSPMRAKLKERRMVSDVVRDLIETSRRVLTPAGLVTLVDTRFLRELTDVTIVTGEHIFAVVDADHLERTGLAVGIVPNAQPKHDNQKQGKPTVAQMRDLKHHYGWTNREMAMEFGVSDASISFWLSGKGSMTGERLEHAWRLLSAMESDKARESANIHA